MRGSRSRTRKALCFSITLIKCVYAYACDFTDFACQRLFTDANVRDPEIADKVGRAAEMAYEAAHIANIRLHSSMELALELMDDKQLGYYFADHKKHVIFWFEVHRSIALMKDVRGVERKSHVSQ
jgi:hypothetical protein